jgi:small subunit ribosomal protein S21
MAFRGYGGAAASSGRRAGFEITLTRRVSDPHEKVHGKDHLPMIKVKSRGNETAEQMLRRFKKACEKEGLTKDIKRVAYYEKPSEKRRRRSRSKPRLKPSR